MQNNYNKCPACGALRGALAAQCPECGYDFTDTNCKVINELNKKLEEASKGRMPAYRKQLEIIRSFTIPQIKEELLDLLIYIQPKATQKNSPVTAEWRLRQKEVIKRAKLAFANERKVLAQVQEYENELTKLERQFVKQWWQKTSTPTKAILIAVLVFIILLLLPAKDISPEAYAIRFAEAVEQGKYDKALECLKKSPDMGRVIAEPYLTLIEAMLQSERVVEAENLYQNLSRYVHRTEDADHLSRTSVAFISYFLAQGNINKANAYVVDINGIVVVLKSLIESGNAQEAVKYYNRNASKLTKYDITARKRVLQFKDEVVEAFVVENNLLR